MCPAHCLMPSFQASFPEHSRRLGVAARTILEFGEEGLAEGRGQRAEPLQLCFLRAGGPTSLSGGEDDFQFPAHRHRPEHGGRRGAPLDNPSSRAVIPGPPSPGSQVHHRSVGLPRQRRCHLEASNCSDQSGQLEDIRVVVTSKNRFDGVPRRVFICRFMLCAHRHVRLVETVEPRPPVGAEGERQSATGARWCTAVAPELRWVATAATLPSSARRRAGAVAAASSPLPAARAAELARLGPPEAPGPPLGTGSGAGSSRGVRSPRRTDLRRRMVGPTQAEDNLLMVTHSPARSDMASTLPG